MQNRVMLAFALDTGRFDPTVNGSMVLHETVKAQAIRHIKLLPFRDIQFGELILSFLKGYAEFKTVSCTSAGHMSAVFR